MRLSPFQFRYSGAGKESPNLISAQEISLPEKGLWLITGPSGAGKSTLLSLIKGLCPYYIPGEFSGEIYYKEKLIDKDFVQQKQNEIVYLFQNPFNQIIFQNPQLEFCFTAESQQVDYFCFQHEQKRLEKEWALGRLLDKKTNELSLGEAQRLLLASLLASAPQVLLLDEPTAFMDKVARDLFYAKLVHLKKKYLVLLIDHHLNEVIPQADGVISVSTRGEVSQQKAVSLVKPDLSELPKTVYRFAESHRVAMNGVSFCYKKQEPLLKEVNFQATSPDVVVLRGANGSGKSTLLKLLAGSLKPQKGKIIAPKNIGYVMQNPEDNFMFDTAVQELANVDTELIERFFSEKNLAVSPFSLSEGEKRRLSLLIHLNPQKKIILYDEPTFGLDEKNKILVAQSILQFKQKNILQIIVSHDDDFISWVADHVYEIRAGYLEKL